MVDAGVSWGGFRQGGLSVECRHCDAGLEVVGPDDLELRRDAAQSQLSAGFECDGFRYSSPAQSGTVARTEIGDRDTVLGDHQLRVPTRYARVPDDKPAVGARADGIPALIERKTQGPIADPYEKSISHLFEAPLLVSSIASFSGHDSGSAGQVDVRAISVHQYGRCVDQFLGAQVVAGEGLCSLQSEEDLELFVGG